MPNVILKAQRPRLNVFLRIHYDLLAQLLQTLIQVLVGEDYARAASQGFDVHTPVPKSGKEDLHGTDPVDCLKVMVFVHVVV